MCTRWCVRLVSCYWGPDGSRRGECVLVYVCIRTDLILNISAHWPLSGRQIFEDFRALRAQANFDSNFGKSVFTPPISENSHHHRRVQRPPDAVRSAPLQVLLLLTLHPLLIKAQLAVRAERRYRHHCTLMLRARPAPRTAPAHLPRRTLRPRRPSLGRRVRGRRGSSVALFFPEISATVRCSENSRIF